MNMKCCISATSDGTVGSLNNTAHGHCNDTKQKVAMKFRLLFCWEASTSKYNADYQLLGEPLVSKYK